MLYFVVFIVVHLFLVFTTGVLSNLNMMFTARNADDWLGIGVFALSVAVTVGVAWLIKPIFISPIAETTGQISTRQGKSHDPIQLPPHLGIRRARRFARDGPRIHGQ